MKMLQRRATPALPNKHVTSENGPCDAPVVSFAGARLAAASRFRLKPQIRLVSQIEPDVDLVQRFCRVVGRLREGGPQRR